MRLYNDRQMKQKKIGIFANPKKDIDLAGTRMMTKLLRARGVEVFFDEGNLPKDEKSVIDYSAVDYLLVLGGDGTILKAALKTAGHSVCMLGFNLGRLGFLTEAVLSEAENAIGALLAGKFLVEQRIMLDCAVLQDEKKVFHIEALNDAAVLKKDLARMINVQLYIGGVLADEVACDGMLVSTPTGSTGYSLSAGGPILSPQLKCLLTTPICAHSLHARTLVVAEDDEIMIRPVSHDGMVLTTDGMQHIDITDGQVVSIRRSKNTARFVRFSGDYFYPLLRKKFMNWDS